MIAGVLVAPVVLVRWYVCQVRAKGLEQVAKVGLAVFN
jgi:hypothetical protein